MIETNSKGFRLLRRCSGWLERIYRSSKCSSDSGDVLDSFGKIRKDLRRARCSSYFERLRRDVTDNFGRILGLLKKKTLRWLGSSWTSGDFGKMFLMLRIASERLGRILR